MPRKQKLNISNKDFLMNFKFCESYKDYNTDTWDDLRKLIRKPGSRIVDEKIADVLQKVRDIV